jgi:KaiC/GvpD/RAD55 family RecA-like ATPase
MSQSGEEAKRIQSLEIIKMRGYKHSFVTAPYDITPDGFRVLSPELMTT